MLSFALMSILIVVACKVSLPACRLGRQGSMALIL
jgi:hypothetical protein